ncbi:MAG: GlsB/YeaQ/YmgE family stress response membrane protein [Anaerolineae bacterium]|nr:GlsB/YeaQ/YmgE family stress response membrane protein [Anaerolineae bacterium]MCA9910864.1 GlsB/YeaQ/YmgE family stress response membrane protein [Anaerolineae bacterium]
MPDTLAGIVQLLIAGLIAGVLALATTSKSKRKRIDILEALVIGVVGAVLGGSVFSLIGLTSTNTLGTIIIAFVGAILLLKILQALRKK